MILITRFAVAATAMGMLTACALGGDGSPGGSNDARTDGKVIATTSIWADVTSAVLCGVPVTPLIPAGADPHTFEPSLRDRTLVELADALVTNGAGLDGSLADLIGAAATTVDLADSIDLIDGDPHFWQDPLRVADAATTIAAAVAASGVPTCEDDYIAQLVELDRDIASMLAQVPDNTRVMVTSHDSLEYFADRYGIEIIGTVIPSTTTLAETNAADLAALAQLIDERNVRVIFTEQLESSSDADALAQRLGVDIVPLVTDALTDDPGTDTYIGMMRSNATAIAQALAP
ncbi:MAG: metal ABC transporter substrate-binding protein [Ilumatobacteraceae bacterium]